MIDYRSICTILLGAALLACGPAFAGVLDKKTAKSNEVVGPAAKGDAKPYHALVQGTCAPGVCSVNFGNKPKVRHIKLITCGLITDEDPLLAGVIFGNLAENDVRFLIPVASVAAQGTGTVSIFEFQFAFDVPAGTKMQVILQASGTPTTGTCTATGTIE